ncbi:hypothetical protein ACWDTT_15755 [Streptosporangium sandarakinum]
MTIRASHYDDAVSRLVADPIVRRMVVGLTSEADAVLTHDDGKTPRFEFMQGANAEYAKRGGVIDAHIGAVAEALLVLRREARTPDTELGKAVVVYCADQALTAEESLGVQLRLRAEVQKHLAEHGEKATLEDLTRYLAYQKPLDPVTGVMELAAGLVELASQNTDWVALAARHAEQQEKENGK